MTQRSLVGEYNRRFRRSCCHIDQYRIGKFQSHLVNFRLEATLFMSADQSLCLMKATFAHATLIGLNKRGNFTSNAFLPTLTADLLWCTSVWRGTVKYILPYDARFEGNSFNLLKPSGYFTYHQVWHSKILHGTRFALSVLYGYQNRQRPLLCTSLTGWFL